MRRKLIHFTGWIISLMVVIIIASAQADQLRIPGRLRYDTDLSLIYSTGIASKQKTKILFQWLAEDLKQPSKAEADRLSGRLGSKEIRERIITALLKKGDLVTIREYAADPAPEKIVKEAAQLVLGMMGDKSQAPALIQILKTGREPEFRVRAAQALGRPLYAVEAKPALQNALQDNFSIKKTTAKGQQIIYPVREAARKALQVLESPQDKESRAQQNKFQKSIIQVKQQK